MLGYQSISIGLTDEIAEKLKEFQSNKRLTISEIASQAIVEYLENVSQDDYHVTQNPAYIIRVKTDLEGKTKTFTLESSEDSSVKYVRLYKIPVEEESKAIAQLNYMVSLDTEEEETITIPVENMVVEQLDHESLISEHAVGWSEKFTKEAQSLMSTEFDG